VTEYFVNLVNDINLKIQETGWTQNRIKPKATMRKTLHSQTSQRQTHTKGLNAERDDLLHT
jgi:hypothetical protein